MQTLKATGLDRKSGGAQWRDLRFGSSHLEMFFDRGIMCFRPTQGAMKTAPIQQLLFMQAPPSPLSSRPERTRISYFALLATTTCAALLKESRMQFIKATGLDRKSGGAQWRDLCVDALSGKCFATETPQSRAPGFSRINSPKSCRHALRPLSKGLNPHFGSMNFNTTRNLVTTHRYGRERTLS